MYNQANQMTKAAYDMTAGERAELFKALTLEQKDAFLMYSFNVVDALETNTKTIKIEDINADDTKTVVDNSISTHANFVSLATTSASNKMKKQKRKEISETKTKIPTRKPTRTLTRMISWVSKRLFLLFSDIIRADMARQLEQY